MMRSINGLKSNIPAGGMTRRIGASIGSTMDARAFRKE
jgi:hypothetical protein